MEDDNPRITPGNLVNGLSLAYRGAAVMGSPDPQTTLNFMREQCQELAIKINELDLDKTEHELVLKALEPLDPDRKCFRMVGNVVVERTVAEVRPAVEKNRDQVRHTRPPNTARCCCTASTRARYVCVVSRVPLALILTDQGHHGWLH